MSVQKTITKIPISLGDTITGRERGVKGENLRTGNKEGINYGNRISEYLRIIPWQRLA